MTQLLTLNRRIASFLSRFLIETRIKPNHITLLSVFCGFVAASFLSLGSRRHLLTAAFFMQLSFILDNCDGEIARAKKLSSEFGMWLDYIADLFVDFAVWVGLAIGCVNAGMGTYATTAAGVAATGSFLNFLRVIRARNSSSHKEREASRSKNIFVSSLQILSDDGDPSLLLWILALIGDPRFILFGGAFYINFLWVFGWIQMKRK